MFSMKRLFVVIAFLVLAQTVYAFDRNESENKIAEYQREWKRLEQVQKNLHDAANEERSKLCKNGILDYCVLDPRKQAVVFVTSYNPVPEQTDGSPCIGAGLTDICEIAKAERVIALSQDLVGRAHWKPFTYGDYVLMEHEDPYCSGVFRVEDTMNKRYSNRADIFSPERSLNGGNCKGAEITKIVL